jgi:hypothetical protein
MLLDNAIIDYEYFFKGIMRNDTIKTVYWYIGILWNGILKYWNNGIKLLEK